MSFTSSGDESEEINPHRQREINPHRQREINSVFRILCTRHTLPV